MKFNRIMFVVCMILIVAIAIVGILLSKSKIPNENQLYPMLAVVVELDEVDDAVICTDFNGHDWAFYGIEDWQVGDYASMIMDDNGTPWVADDIIVSVRYDGWLDGAFGWDGYRPIFIYEN